MYTNMNATDTVRHHLTGLRDRSKELKDAVDASFKSQKLSEDFFQPVTVRIEGKPVTVARGFLVIALSMMEELKPRIVSEAKNGKRYAEEISVSD